MRGDLLELKPENFDRVLDVNLRGTVFLTQAVARAMLAAPGDHPRIDHHHHLGQRRDGLAGAADYCISKAGLSMWAKNLALRLPPDGIAVFEVRPGIIRTDMTAGVAAKYDALIDGGLVPARRWGEAARCRRASSPRLPAARSASPPARSSMSTARCRSAGCEAVRP